MIVSFNMRVNYDVAYEEHITHDLCVLGGGIRDEIQPMVFYLSFVLVGTNFWFRYIHGSTLYIPLMRPLRFVLETCL